MFFPETYYLSIDRPLTPFRVIRVISLSLLPKISKLLPKISGGRSHFSLKFWASLNPGRVSLMFSQKGVGVGGCHFYSQLGLAAVNAVAAKMKCSFNIWLWIFTPVGFSITLSGAEKEQSYNYQHVSIGWGL